MSRHRGAAGDPPQVTTALTEVAPCPLPEQARSQARQRWDAVPDTSRSPGSEDRGAPQTEAGSAGKTPCPDTCHRGHSRDTDCAIAPGGISRRLEIAGSRLVLVAALATRPGPLPGTRKCEGDGERLVSSPRRPAGQGLCVDSTHGCADTGMTHGGSNRPKAAPSQPRTDSAHRLLRVTPTALPPIMLRFPPAHGDQAFCPSPD